MADRPGGDGAAALSQRPCDAPSAGEDVALVADSGAGSAAGERPGGVAGGVIHLPWPPRAVHPNARQHWAPKARATRRMRQDAAWSARAAGLRAADGSLTVRLRFCPPDARRRDLDGMIASCKAYLDGIADALGVDDSRFALGAMVCAPVAAGAVEIEVIEG